MSFFCPPPLPPALSPPPLSFCYKTKHPQSHILRKINIGKKFNRIICVLFTALNDGVNVRGYTAWSLLDKFEWNKGFSERFGFYHVDFKNKDKPRYPKASVDYYKNIISANGFPNPREVMSITLFRVHVCAVYGNYHTTSWNNLHDHGTWNLTLWYCTLGMCYVLMLAECSITVSKAFYKH